jgi:PHD/YefM family antitoxin component YafN of YafNO toxin-antitoxin module
MSKERREKFLILIKFIMREHNKTEVISMPKIMPITVLRDTTAISETCRELGEPVFITKNGYGDMVVMSLETYERELALIDVYRKLSVAERQIANGETMDVEAVFAGLRTKYGS